MPLGLALVRETTVFREYGPLAGNTVRIGYEYAPKFGNMLSRQTADVDARYYLRLATNGVLAFRARGFKSWGEFPGYLYFGGNSELRGYDYLQFLGNKAFFANAELRFPLIEAALTPLGVIGGLRGIAFANSAPPDSKGSDAGLDEGPDHYTPLIGYEHEPGRSASQAGVSGAPQSIDGFKLVDGRASYGFGLETFALGFPIHFDWSWRTLFNKDWEDYVFAYQGSLEGDVRQPVVPEAAVLDVDRIRFLDPAGRQSHGDPWSSRCERPAASRMLSADHAEPKQRCTISWVCWPTTWNASCRRTSTPELERHLAACPRCVAQLKTYESTVSLLRSIQEDDLPPELRCTLEVVHQSRAASN